VSWKNRLPWEVGDVVETPEGFSMQVPIPTGDDGYFGRSCPACERFFKMLAAEYDALPDDVELTCPYCGERRDHGDFLTPDQEARTESAMDAAVEQYLHRTMDDILRQSFGGRRGRSSGGLVTLEWRYEPGHPPMPRALYEYVEEQVRRTIRCSNCGTHAAVYGSAAFCPVCGPRAAAEEVGEAIAGQRLALALPDQLPEDARETARAAGVFDQHADATIKDIATLFETFMRGVFTDAVPNAAAVLAGERPNVFQNLSDTQRLFVDHLGWSVAGAVGPSVWDRLGISFEKRHVLVHRNGRVDQRYLDRIPTGALRLGQRLVITRREAEEALDDLEAVVAAVQAWRSSTARGC